MPTLWRPSKAATLTVTNLQDSGAGSLRDVVANAASGDTIIFQTGLTGTINLAGAIRLTKTITVQGPGAAIISLISTQHSVFYVPNTRITIQISGLSIIGSGGDTSANVIETLSDNVGDGSLTFTDMVFDQNLGVIRSRWILHFERCTFTRNVFGVINVSESGASNAIAYLTVKDSSFINNPTLAINIQQSSGQSIIENTIFSGNNSAVSSTGNLLIKKSTFSGNTNGAVSLSSNQNVEQIVEDSIFENNTGRAPLRVNSANAEVRRSLFKNNTTSDNVGGGAIYSDQGASLRIYNSTFYQNSTSNGAGGAIFAQSAVNIQIGNSTFWNNSASSGGSTLHGTGGDFALKNTIIGTDIAGATLCSALIADQGYNLRYGDATNSCPGSIPSANPLLGGLANNGGMTQTMALLSGSPAINGGNPDGCSDFRTTPRPLPTDQRGYARNVGGHCDIGAFEADSSANFTATITNTPIFSQTPTLTLTVSPTNTFTATATNTSTLTPTPPVLTYTPTRTPTPTPIPQMLIVNTLADVDNVTCLEDCSLRSALGIAGNGDTISFAPTLYGTIYLQSPLHMTHSVIINGPGAERITIDGQDRMQIFDSFTGSPTIRGLTFAHGAATRGGVFQIINGSNQTFTFESVVMRANTAIERGGAIDIVNYGMLKLINCTFDSNVSSGTPGGAIYDQNGGLTIQDSIFQNNRASFGGAIYTETLITVTSTQFISNHAAFDGGALYDAYVYAALALNGASFNQNQAERSGGAIYSNYAMVTLRDSTVRQNTAQHGGGIYHLNWAGDNALTVSGSLIADNVATAPYAADVLGGGGIFSSGKVVISNSTLANNAAAIGGGLQYTGTEYDAKLYNVTVFGNTAQNNSGGGVASTNDGGIVLTNTILANNTGRNCVGNIQANSLDIQYPNYDCIGATIADPLLLPLANNGGGSQTMGLAVGSPAINTADVFACQADPVNNRDQRGYQRVDNAYCDVGAYELTANGPTPTSSSTPTATATQTPIQASTFTPTATFTLPPIDTATPVPVTSLLIVTNLTDNNDGVCDGDCSLREAIARSDTGGTIHFATGLTGTIHLRAQITINQSLTIEGSTTDVVAIDGGDTMTLFTTFGSQITLKNLIFSNGGYNVPVSGTRAAIVNEMSTLTISNCVFYSNYIAINNDAYLTVIASDFQFNGYSVNGNTGVAILMRSLRGLIFSSHFSNNILAIMNYAQLDVDSSTFTTTGSSGTDIYKANGAMNISNSTFIGTRNGAPTIRINNTQQSGLNYNPLFVITNSTFAGNDTVIFADIGSVILRNSILQAPANSTQKLCDRVLVIDGGGNTQYPGTSCGTTIPSIDAQLGTPGDYGGAIDTIPLLSNSPVRDAGLNGVCGLPPVYNFDERGYTRPVDGDLDGIARCDSGAFEFGALPSPTPTPTLTATNTATPVPLRPDTIGVYKNGTFYLRNSNSAGDADITPQFGGDISDLPVAGDWNGEGIDSIGVYRNSTGVFFLSNSNTTPNVDYTLVFGNPGDTPFVGKWSADMNHDSVGVYRNSNGILYQKKQLTTGFSDFYAVFGNPGDRGISGDWNGNGFDSIGVYRSLNQMWYLTNNSQPSGITFSDLNFTWDIATAAPVVGDWDGNATSTVGYLTISGVFVLHPNNATVGTDNIFPFGPANAKPLAGKWVSALKPPLSNLMQPDHSAGAANPQSGDAD